MENQENLYLNHMLMLNINIKIDKTTKWYTFLYYIYNLTPIKHPMINILSIHPFDHNEGKIITLIILQTQQINKRIRFWIVDNKEIFQNI